MIRIAIAIAFVLSLAASASAQDPVKQPAKDSKAKSAPAKARPAAPEGDILALPFPTKFPSLQKLGAWSVNAQATAHRRMAEARSRGDRAEVSRLVTRLDKVRQHAAAMLRMMQERLAPRA